MGSSNSHGDIAIQLESYSNFTGQETTGMIHLNVKSQIESCTLYLRFFGKEKTAWTETRSESSVDSDGKSKSETVTDYFNGKLKICNFSRAIYSWHDKLSPGQYSLPFSFILPGNIPSSFHYKSGSTEAGIYYRIQGFVQSVSNQKIKGKTRISIKQPVGTFNSNIKIEKRASIKSCCYTQGNCKISVFYPQDTYNPSQIANFYAEIDNSGSKVAVIGVNCRLLFSLRIKDDYRRTKVIKEEVLRETSDLNIAPGQALMQSSSVAVSLNLPSKKHLLDEMFSTKGALIECVYTNEVSAVMNSSCMCFGDQPSINTSMTIVPNLIVQPSAPVAPPGWNPEVLDRVRVSYEPRYEIQPSAPEYMENYVVK